MSSGTAHQNLTLAPLEAIVLASDSEKIYFCVEWSQDRSSPSWTDFPSQEILRNTFSPGANREVHFTSRVDGKEKEHSSSYKRRHGGPVG